MFNCYPYLKVEESQAQKGGNSPEVTEPVSPRVLGTWCFFPKTPLRTLWKKLALDHSEAQQAIQNLPQAWGYQGLQPVCQSVPPKVATCDRTLLRPLPQGLCAQTVYLPT